MPMIYLLDSGPLGLLAHNKLKNRMAIEEWLMGEVAAGATVYLSEVADYEVRRELVRLIQAGQLPAAHLNRLNQLPTLFPFLSVTTAMWRRAAEFWADARTRGLPTASPAALDGDVLIAAQAAEIKATVVTTNAAHISVWVPVKLGHNRILASILEEATRGEERSVCCAVAESSPPVANSGSEVPSLKSRYRIEPPEREKNGSPHFCRGTHPLRELFFRFASCSL